MLNQSKTSRYLAYALGEIFLVVIGIIIAVSINNWNEQRKANIQESKTLAELKNALQADLVDIKFNIKWHEQARNACVVLLEVIDQKIPYNDSLSRHFGAMGQFSQFLPDQSTYEGMKATGLGLISNDSLRLRLAHYYENEVNFALGTEAINRSLLPMNLALFRKHFYIKNLLNNAVPRNYNELVKDREFISYLYETQGFRQNEVGLFQDLEILCNELISLINKELNNSK